MSDAMTSLLKVNEVAGRLRVSTGTVYELIRCGKLKAKRIGARLGALRVDEKDVEVYLEGATSRAVDRSPERRPQRAMLKHIRLPR